MAGLRSPEDLFARELRSIHSAERQLSRVLPRLAKKANSEKLRELLGQRREQGEHLIEQLDECFSEMGLSKARGRNVAAEGLIDETTQIMEEIENEKLCDPLLIASVQKVEHYCMAAWGTARAMGELLGREHVAEVMKGALEDGKQLDKEMTQFAETEVNPRMMEGEEGEEADNTEEEGRSTKGRSRSTRH